MKKYYLKKEFMIGLVVVLAGITISQGATSQDITQIPIFEKMPTIWYVDDSGNNTNNGTSWKEAWRNINYAINNNAVMDGHTIRAGEGNYNENVIIDKSLKIIGNGSGYTIIDGNHKCDVIKIIQDNVIIREVTIKNSGPLSNGINVRAENCQILMCSINDNYNGLNFLGLECQNNSIKNCNIFNNDDTAILFISKCEENTIEMCCIKDNPWGIVILEAENNRIEDSTLKRHNKSGLVLQGQFSISLPSKGLQFQRFPPKRKSIIIFNF